MEIKRGIPVSPGVAIGPVFVLDSDDRPIPRRRISKAEVTQEKTRLSEAIEKSINELVRVQEESEKKFGMELARIFEFHLGMLRDRFLLEKLNDLIEQEKVTAEYAAYATLRSEANKLKSLDNPLFRDRVKDIWDLERRILSQLLGSRYADLSGLTTESIIVAYDLTPSETASLNKDHIKGMATDAGGRTSHTAILAHALGIPAIVGMEDLSQRVNSGDTIIIDGDQGTVIINPDAAQLLQYRERMESLSKQADTLRELGHLPAVTTDGTEIELQSNIEFPTEIDAAVAHGAQGIGLYRTEFLYLSSEGEPTEEVHYQAYVDAIHRLEGKPLTIRTLDLGADKYTPEGIAPKGEHNPFLGCRSIRLCLQNLPLFKTQLRAILRASAEGPIRVMFPLISNIMELRQSKMVFSDVLEDLEDEGIPFASNIPVGMMVEVPSSALQIRTFLNEVDFVSIGTNDLIQYTVAVDRGNERIANLYSAAHPAVIQLIREVIRASTRQGVKASLCGEMAGEPEFVILLLGLGLRSLSVTPPAIPEVKRVIRSVSINQCQRIARKVAGFDSDREIHNYLRQEVRRIVPDAFEGRSMPT